jgi:hypothetical protein
MDARNPPAKFVLQNLERCRFNPSHSGRIANPGSSRAEVAEGISGGWWVGEVAEGISASWRVGEVAEGISASWRVGEVAEGISASWRVGEPIPPCLGSQGATPL